MGRKGEPRNSLDNYKTTTYFTDYDIFMNTGERVVTRAEDLTREEIRANGKKMNDRGLRTAGYIPISELSVAK